VLATLCMTAWHTRIGKISIMKRGTMTPDLQAPAKGYGKTLLFWNGHLIGKADEPIFAGGS
jgi:hypothetical protein